MSEKRMAVVKHAFQALDEAGARRVALDKVCKMY